MPCNGSAYTYTYAIYGELPAWIMAWIIIIKYGGASAALSRAVVSYGVGLIHQLGGTVPLYLYDLKLYGFSCSILTVTIIFLFTFIMNRGSKESSIFNAVFTITKIVALLLITVVAAT